MDSRSSRDKQVQALKLVLEELDRATADALAHETHPADGDAERSAGSSVYSDPSFSITKHRKSRAEALVAHVVAGDAASLSVPAARSISAMPWRQSRVFAIAAAVIVLVGMIALLANRLIRSPSGELPSIASHSTYTPKYPNLAAPIRKIREGPLAIMAAEDAILERHYENQELIVKRQSGTQTAHPLRALAVRFRPSSDEFLDAASPSELKTLAADLKNLHSQRAKWRIEVHPNPAHDFQGGKVLCRDRALRVVSTLVRFGTDASTVSIAEDVASAPYAFEGDALARIAKAFNVEAPGESLVLIVKENQEIR